MRAVPDTCAFIEFFEGSERGKIVRRHLKESEIILCPICIYEIIYVLGRSHSKRVAEEFTRGLLAHYRVVPIDEEIAAKGAQIRMSHDMPMGDSLIYATARHHGAKVISGCTHFLRLRKEKDVIII